MSVGKERLLIVGARGQSRAVGEVIKAVGGYEVAGLLDDFEPVGTQRMGYKILGGMDDLQALCARLAVTTLVVAIGDNYQREAMAMRIHAAVPEVRFATLVHPSAVVGSDVEIGEGTVIMPGAVVVSGCRIGRGCVLNTGCVLDHDGVMEDWSSLGPGAVAGGNVRVGARSFVGLGARITHRVTIGRDTVVGAGSLVLKDVCSRVVAYGSPCKVIRKRSPDEHYL